MPRKKTDPPEREVVLIPEEDDPGDQPADDGDLLGEEATVTEIRDFLMQYIPEVHGVFFADEVDQLDIKELRHHYEDVRIYFAASIEDYRKSPDKNTKLRRRRNRKLARHRHLCRVELISSGAAVKTVMLHDHPNIWRLYQDYLINNGLSDMKPPSEANIRRADIAMPPLLRGQVVSWIMTRPKGRPLELPLPKTSEVVKNILGITPGDTAFVSKSQVSTAPVVRSSDYPPHRPPDPKRDRSESSRRQGRSPASKSPRFSRGRSPERRHSSSKSAPVKLARPVITSIFPSEVAAEAAKTVKKETAPESTSGEDEIKVVEIVRKPSVVQPAPESATSTETNKPEDAPTPMDTTEQPPAPAAPVMMTDKETNTEKSICLSTEDYQKLVDSHKEISNHVKDLTTRNEVLSSQNEDLSHQLYLLRAQAGGVSPQPDVDLRTMITKAKLREPLEEIPTYEPVLPPTDEAVTEDEPEQDQQIPVALKSCLRKKSTPKKKGKIEFGGCSEVLFENDFEYPDGQIAMGQIILESQVDTTSAPTVNKPAEPDVEMTPTVEELAEFFETPARKSEAACGCQDAVEGVVIFPNKNGRQSDASLCDKPNCILRRPRLDEYNFVDRGKPYFHVRPAEEAWRDADVNKPDSKYNFHDLMKTTIYDKRTNDWPGVLSELRSSGFESSIDEFGFFTLETLDCTQDRYNELRDRYREEDAAKAKGAQDDKEMWREHPSSATRHQGHPVGDHAFSALVIGAPNGMSLVVVTNFDGKKCEASPIPKEVRGWLEDPGTFKVGFNIMGATLLRLRYSALEIMVANPVAMENWTHVCFPDVRQVFTRNYLAVMHGCSVKNRFRSAHDGLGLFKTHEQILNPMQTRFDKTMADWSTQMRAYVRYVAMLPLAFLDKSAARLVELDDMSMSTNVVPVIHMILAWLAGWKVRDKFWTDKGLEAGEKDRFQFPDWMVSDFSPNPWDKSTYKNMAWPLHFTKGTYTEWPNVFVRMASMRRRHMVDYNAVSREVRNMMHAFTPTKGIDKLDASHFLAKYCKNDHPQEGGKFFPHFCARCGSFDHEVEDCTLSLQPAMRCLYPLCENRAEHTTRVCPKLNSTCSACRIPGHHATDHKKASLLRFWTDIRLAARVGYHVSRLHDIDVGLAYKKDKTTEKPSIDLLKDGNP